MSLQAIAGEQMEPVQKQLAHLEAAFGGQLGVAAINTGNNQRIRYRANESFPMGCTSKVIGVAAILKKSMKDNQLLQERVMYGKNDLRDWVPITKKHITDGMTVADKEKKNKQLVDIVHYHSTSLLLLAHHPWHCDVCNRN